MISYMLVFCQLMPLVGTDNLFMLKITTPSIHRSSVGVQEKEVMSQCPVLH